jgi:hypothetical protein
MNWLQQLGLGGDGSPDADPSLWADIRSGRAGFPVRIGLSLALAAGAIGIMLFVFGLMENRGGYVREAHIAMGFCFAGAAWCGAMVWIWSSYRRLCTIVKTIFTILGLWAVAIPLCVVIEETLRRAEYIIGSVIVLSIGATAMIITLGALRAAGGRPLRDAEGRISVRCPQCGYTMVGLKACTCPECGAAFTLDELIGAQNYAALRGRTAGPVDEDGPTTLEEPVQALPALPQGADE